MKRIWRKAPRWLKAIVVSIVACGMLLLIVAAGGWWYLNPAVSRTDGVVYGQRHDRPLYLDVIQPANPNGLGIAFMASGGWKSGEPGETPVWLMAPLLRRGYTVFSIYHISQPQATVQEIIEDVNRGVRFVRHHADDYGIDPNRIGVSGGSAGGHLSLMLGTCGAPGSEDSEDPVDHESSEVQAIAIFYPVTDLLNMGDSTENPGDGGPPVSFVKSFGPDATDMEKWKVIGHDCSPIYHVTSELPPTLIYHGDADTLTPLDQSERFCEQARAEGCEVQLVVHPGGKHGWLTMHLDLLEFGNWFDQHLMNEAASLPE